MRVILHSLWAAILMITISGCGSTHSADHAEIAAKGAMIMPFDLEKTTHIFETMENGGRQQVIVDSKDDTKQIDLIRQHLAEEADRFAQGDFQDPAMIHGEDMPGLQDMIAGVEDIQIVYSEVPEGGQILYTTEVPELVEAIHLWFEAQLSDHASHAQGHR